MRTVAVSWQTQSQSSHCSCAQGGATWLALLTGGEENGTNVVTCQCLSEIFIYLSIIVPLIPLRIAITVSRLRYQTEWLLLQCNMIDCDSESPISSILWLQHFGSKSWIHFPSISPSIRSSKPIQNCANYEVTSGPKSTLTIVSYMYKHAHIFNIVQHLICFGKFCICKYMYLWCAIFRYFNNIVFPLTPDFHRL